MKKLLILLTLLLSTNAFASSALNFGNLGVTAQVKSGSWSGYQVNSGGWSNGSASFAAFSNATSVTTTAKHAYNISCVSNALVPGLTCTLPQTGPVQICYSATFSDSATANRVWIKLVDNSGNDIGSGVGETTPNGYWTSAKCVNYNATSTTINFQLWGYQNTGTFHIGSLTGVEPLEWNISEIGGSGGTVNDWVDAGAPTIIATTTNPTKGTTTTDKLQYKRIGDSAIIKYNYVQTAAGSSGSGDYLITLPAGLVIDTTKQNVSTTDMFSNIVGTAMLSIASNGYGSTTDLGRVYAYDSTHLGIAVVHGTLDALSVWGSSLFNFGAQANCSVNLTATVPISGW